MTLRVAIGGFGAIGKVIAEHLDRRIEGLRLAAVSARDTARAEAAMAGFAEPVPVLPLSELGASADIVVECAPAHLLREIAEPALGHGRLVMVLSCGALLDNFDLVELARRHGGRILVPTGALLGLDAVGGGGRGRDIERAHDHAKAAGRPDRRALSRSARHRHRKIVGAQAGLRRQCARGCPRLSGQRQRRRGIGAGRDRPRAHDDRDLGRPSSHPQHPPDRGRGATLRAFRCRSRMCPRPKIRRPGA